MVVIEVILTLERFMESFHHLLSAGVLGLVAVWIASKGDVIVRRSGQTGQVGWENVASCDNEMTPPEDLDSMLEEDPTQLYLSILFSPGAFLSALHSYQDSRHLPPLHGPRRPGDSQLGQTASRGGDGHGERGAAEPGGVRGD